MATAKERRRVEGMRDLAQAAAEIVRERGPLGRTRLEELVREKTGRHFSAGRFTASLEEYGATCGMESSGRRPRVWSLKPTIGFKAPANGYGPDTPAETLEERLTREAGGAPPSRIIMRNCTIHASGHAPGQIEPPLLDMDGGGLPIGAPHPARPAALDGVHQLARDLGIPPEFPHPDKLDRPEPAAPVQPIAGVSFPGAHRLGTWRVFHPSPGRDVIEIHPPQGEPVRLAIGTAVSLGDALRQVAAQAAARLREAQSAD